MKKIIFIFVSLFLFTTANADNLLCSTIENDQKKQECMKDAALEDNRKSCESAITAYNSALSEAKKTADENKETARVKLKEMDEDFSEKTAKAQEDMAAAQKEAQDAEISYDKTRKALQDALDEYEKSANEQGQELVENIQSLISKLEESMVKREEFNTQHQNSIMQGYEACKQSAEQLFMSKLGIIRDANKKNNSGYTFSGGVSLATPSKVKKARAEAKKAHQTCVAETKRVLQAKLAADLQRLANDEKRINQNIAARQQELDRVTNTEYKKKLASLEADLQSAQKELISAQEKATKDQQRIAQKMSTDKTNYDTHRALVSARADVGVTPNGNVIKDRKKLKQDEKAQEEQDEVCNVCLISEKSYYKPRAATICAEAGKSENSGGKDGSAR